MATNKQTAAILRGTAKNLVAQAAQLSALANELEPPAPKPFVGRSTVDPKVWRESFSESFDTIAAEGEFLDLYKGKWSAYPTHYQTTSKLGYYDPYRISVIDTGGLRIMNCRLMPGTKTASGRPSGTAAQPRFGPHGDGRTLSEKIEMRVRIVNPVKDWHVACLGWPLDNSTWPAYGEDDFWEQQTDATVGAFLHVKNGGHNGERQVAFETKIKPTDWVVIGRERIAGKSYKWFVNGKQVGQTVTKDVPDNYFRWVLQLEDGGTPTEACNIQFDWFTLWEPT